MTHSKQHSKFDLVVRALQVYLKQQGFHMGFIKWNKLKTTKNHKAKNQFHNITVKGIAEVEDYKRQAIHVDVPVHFTFAQTEYMEIEVKKED